ncbi:Non-reducing end beta-L-arabinofuranosidase [Microbacterium foliorum]|uniref:Non-reducing end beta-L-arabinofuranosidase n=2 Tax=Microbacterium foliorum TaxID=104336 RepID=A0A0F0KQ71_9MICO|nr:beta-L-arabinofuranosidase domain-containing protein [Microbacterium foliorum]KJL23023.1 Non-reducing end beta-L-arabinofuranosidase [Microbacterium foliorum]
MFDTTTPAAPVVPTRGRLRPLGLDEVSITGGFWGERQAVNGSATLAHIESRLESEGWLPNFDLAAAGSLPAGRRGREFSDSEIYKYLEALAWEIGRTDAGADDDLERRFRRIVERVGAAQEPDGYLDTMFGRAGQDERWTALQWGHELYCLGHLFQAAVARIRTRPEADDGLIDIARRAADLVCREFGADGRDAICGHSEVEVGLAELGRALGERRYIDQAALFVERHGRGSLGEIEWGRSYFQDDVSVRDAEALRGHAVRANYLASGATDVAVERDDAALLDALRGQWDRTVERRTYVTGGQGSHHQDEAFGDDWELPPDRAYSETCAGIGSVMFSWRLLLATGEAQYADLIERTLFNVVATSPGSDGRSFFYANTLHQRTPGIPADPDATSPRASSSLRAPWFEVSCCPPNVARTFASLAAYVATADDDGVQLHQYAPAQVRTSLPDGRAVAFDVATGYPVDGTIRITVVEDAEFVLTLRVPSWASGAALRVTTGAGVSEEPVLPGTVAVERAFRVGDVVELVLPLVARVSTPDPMIDAVRGCVVVERGPEVWALESVDFGADVAEAVVAGDPVEVEGRVALPLRRRSSGDVATVPLVPYHDWAQRGPSTMRVWVPTV